MRTDTGLINGPRGDTAQKPLLTEPTKIVFILSRYGIGGAEKQLANLIANRPDATAQIMLHTITLLPPTSEDVQEQFEAVGVSNTLIDRESKSFPRFFMELVWALRRLRPDIVSTFLDSSAGTWGRLAALVARVPHIAHSVRAMPRKSSWARKSLKPLLNSSTALFLPNAHSISRLLTDDGIDDAKIKVVTNGVDASVFNPDKPLLEPMQWGARDEGLVLGYLGRFDAIKRIDLLLAALTSMDPQLRPSLVVLAGDGPTMPYVQSVIADDPWLATHCRLLGAVNRTVEFLAGIDYLVLPSDSEGFPNVVLEAMAMRKPVIATRTSDVPAIVADTGLLVEPGEVGALESAIEKMQRMSQAERAELGRKSRERIISEYTIEAAAARFWAAHLDLLRKAS